MLTALLLSSAALKKAEAEKADMEKKMRAAAREKDISKDSDDENNEQPETPTPNRKSANTQIPRPKGMSSSE